MLAAAACACALNARMADAQQVRSRDSSASVSELLRPPGQGSYRPPVDWGRLPPWEQTSFFGIRAQGQLFVYVVDASGSMNDAQRMLRAKAELRRSIMALRWPQRFLVIFFDDAPRPMPGGLPAAAGIDAKSRFLRWLASVDAEGGTDPRAAMKSALGLKPDAVFLLSDGEFPPGTAEAIGKANTARVPIHCVDLSGGVGRDLIRIAAESGGEYISRP